MSSMTVRVTLVIALLGTGSALAQGGPASSQSAKPPVPSSEMLPIRAEFGGYNYWVDNGFGDWRGVRADLWLGRGKRFTSGFMFDSQTRPTGTQQNYAFMSLMNWSQSFYTVQSVSGAPQKSDLAIYFPEIRYDLKGYWKLPPDKKYVLSAGYTHFDLGHPGRGDIYNVGGLYYHGKCVVEGNLFVNESKPGGLWSTSGSFSVQYGTEGKFWIGLTASGGKELYRLETLMPLDVKLNSYTFDLFYRRWIKRHFGYTLGLTYQDKLKAYRRAGVSARLFVEY